MPPLGDRPLCQKLRLLRDLSSRAEVLASSRLSANRTISPGPGHPLASHAGHHHPAGLDLRPVQTIFFGDIWAAWFTAVGTVAVAVMAIWGDWVRARIAGPRLRLSLRQEGFPTPRTDGVKSWNALYYHVEVSNARGWSPANAVRVLVVGLARRVPDGTFIAEPLITRFQLTWAFPEFHELFPTITDGTETCDLGYLDGPAAQQFRLSTYIRPATFPGYVDRNDAVRVTLVASAHNGQSNQLIVEVSWDGIWQEGEMRKHLVVKDVSPQR